MDVETMVACFNEWMREYIEDPAAFEHTLATVKKYETELAAGQAPSYGHGCVAVLQAYAEKLRGLTPGTTVVAPPAA